MSDDRGRDMMTSHLEKGKTLRHPAHSGQATAQARRARSGMPGSSIYFASPPSRPDDLGSKHRPRTA
jgi:hypothetical protein